MRSKESQERLQMTPLEAVADAMMVAYAVYLQGDFSEAIGIVKLENILVETTKDRCRQNSVTVLAYLTERYPKLFDNMLIVESVADCACQLRNDWSWHDYFLVQGEDGVWYAGSPANYELGGEKTRLTNLISGNLKKVMGEIKRIEGGAWPTICSVEEIVDKVGGYTSLDGDFGDGSLSALCVRYELGETLAERNIYEMGLRNQSLRPATDWLKTHVRKG